MNYHGTLVSERLTTTLNVGQRDNRDQMAGTMLKRPHEKEHTKGTSLSNLLTTRSQSLRTHLIESLLTPPPPYTSREVKGTVRGATTGERRSSLDG